ncbi:MAG: hypothetical protein RL095_1637 [Verrucomicrobiota bacterium]|jgi:flagellar basal-body rod protein FlgB
MIGTDYTSELISKMMHLSVRRQELLANNLANLNTPGYTRRDLNFAGALGDAVRKDDLNALRQLNPEVTMDKSGSVRLDGNNVNAASEMNEMTQNGTLHALLAKAYSTRQRILKSAIR